MMNGKKSMCVCVMVVGMVSALRGMQTEDPKTDLWMRANNYESVLFPQSFVAASSVLKTIQENEDNQFECDNLLTDYPSAVLKRMIADYQYLTADNSALNKALTSRHLGDIYLYLAASRLLKMQKLVGAYLNLTESNKK